MTANNTTGDLCPARVHGLASHRWYAGARDRDVLSLPVHSGGGRPAARGLRLRADRRPACRGRRASRRSNGTARTPSASTSTSASRRPTSPSSRRRRSSRHRTTRTTDRASIAIWPSAASTRACGRPSSSPAPRPTSIASMSVASALAEAWPSPRSSCRPPSERPIQRSTSADEPPSPDATCPHSPRRSSSRSSATRGSPRRSPSSRPRRRAPAPSAPSSGPISR